jgi:hypothetical protein
VGGRAGPGMLLALLLWVLLGCGGGAPGEATPSDQPSASAAVLSEAVLAVCDGTVRMTQGATALQRIRLRQGAAGQLGNALDLVVEGQQLVLDYAPSVLRTRVRSLGFAVTNITIAIEGFRTTNDLATAADTIRRRTTALRRAIDSFRVSVGCPAPGAARSRAAATEPPASSGG